MKTAEQLYTAYRQHMLESGVEVNHWDTLAESGKSVWFALQRESSHESVELTANIDYTKVEGLTELLVAADEFVAKVENGTARSTRSYNAFKSALSKIGEYDVDFAQIVSIRGPKDKPEQFYHMDAKPQVFDIDEELGELLIACMRGLEFIHNGPAIQTTEDVIQSMYESHVTKLIPKLEATIANRIIVKHPFHSLVDERFGKLYRLSSPRPLDQMTTACGVIENYNDQMVQAFENFSVGDSIAESTIAELANMTIAMQQIMNIFGWTWDDVKLKARQQLSKVE